MSDAPNSPETPPAPPAPPKSTFERLIATAQGLGILIALVVSGLNVWFYISDREQRALKEVFDDQLAITKLYFEKMANLQSRDWCREAPLFANTSAIIARMTLDEARVRIRQLKDQSSTKPGSDLLSGIERHSGVQALAVMIIDNFDQRLNSKECDAAVVVPEVAASAPGALVHAEAPSGLMATSYGLIAATAPAAPPAPPPLPNPAMPAVMTVYIQYPAGTDAQARAAALRDKMRTGLVLGETKFVSPAVEAVKQTPGRDQIRIYRDADESKARELQRALDLADAQIVSLARAYKSLPGNTMEIWLKTP